MQIDNDNSKKKVTLVWHTKLDEAQLAKFIELLDATHQIMYGLVASAPVEAALLSKGVYNGAVNHITINIEEPK